LPMAALLDWFYFVVLFNSDQSHRVDADRRLCFLEPTV